MALSPEYREAVVVAPSDVDELGHASNLAYVRWVQEVAKAHSRAVGWDHAAYVRLGAVFVVRRHEIDYLHPAYEAERIELVTWIESWSAATSERKTKILRASDGTVFARASTTWALVSIDSGRPRRIPPEVRDAFATLP